ncbi:hypothetical protein Q0590_06670 [Rhodocytophaga aerolata]|uniref:Lipocalin-like domain-containing protein n=1 Tax=Rhodocytophaga aerolata TaxID=455078 RepID=A0ABT8R1F7_9BACT|nr:DUF5004 domain-containing protein [Rhodocytophaga aerolata]MDO1445927.1 hypothetical protein [Rhodocytophaga aerolata]
MKNINTFYLLVFCLMVPLLYACPGKEPNPASKTELIQKNWKVRQVTANDSPVYTDPPVSTPNSQNYANYRLNFTSATGFSRTDVSGTVTTGTWQFDNNENPQKIIFSTGNPLEVELESLAENSLEISYVVQSTKTGDTEYRIILIPAQ